MKKKIIVGIGVGIAGLVGLFVAARTSNPTNIADTAPEHAETALRTRRYGTDLKTFRAEAERIVPALSTWGRNWKYVSAEENENAVLIKAEVPVIVFTDDLEIKAEKSADGVVVNVHSNSRVGKSDFGENRRHLLQILEALDAVFEKRRKGEEK